MHNRNQFGVNMKPVSFRGIQRLRLICAFRLLASKPRKANDTKNALRRGRRRPAKKSRLSTRRLESAGCHAIRKPSQASERADGVKDTDLEQPVVTVERGHPVGFGHGGIIEG